MWPVGRLTEVIVGLVLLRGFVRGVRAQNCNSPLVETLVDKCDGLLFFRSSFPETVSYSPIRKKRPNWLTQAAALLLVR
jgi:hypothetical protein